MYDKDKLKLEQLYIKYWKLVMYVALKVLRNEADAEDAAQQTFLAVMGHLSKIGDINSPSTKAYLAVAAERKAIDIRRAKSRLTQLDDYMLNGVEENESCGLDEAMAQLPPRYRDVLLLRFYEGYTTQEFSEMLNISVDAVRKLLWRAKRMLTEKLEAEE